MNRVSRTFGIGLPVLALVCLMMVSASVVAQSGDIVNADYSAQRSWVNVTNQVRSMVRNGSLNFRVTTDAFGIGDPTPNVVKTLRLRERGLQRPNPGLQLPGKPDRQPAVRRVGESPQPARTWLQRKAEKR